jgi:hypothetical protein
MQNGISSSHSTCCGVGAIVGATGRAAARVRFVFTGSPPASG